MYQGQYYDDEIELTYNRFRYYDPNDGRYISQDPIGLHSGEYNFYNYVEDPNEEIDPYGLEGIIYLRIDPKTKKEYVGKSKSPEAFQRRQYAHNGKRKKSMGDDYDGKKYEFVILQEDIKGKKRLQFREQYHINKKGGISKLENKIRAQKKRKRKKKSTYKK